MYFTKHLPVLEAAVDLYDSTGRAVQIAQLVAATALDEATVQRAVKALVHEHLRLLDDWQRGSLAETGPALPSDPTGEARAGSDSDGPRRRLPGRLLDVLDVLDEQAEQAVPEDRPRFRRVRDGVVSAAVTSASRSSPRH